MEKCYYCEREFSNDELYEKKVFDPVLLHTICVKVCAECVDMIDDGLERNFNQELS